MMDMTDMCTGLCGWSMLLFASLRRTQQRPSMNCVGSRRSLASASDQRFVHMREVNLSVRADGGV